MPLTMTGAEVRAAVGVGFPAEKNFRRARRPEHKQQRRLAILDAARDLAIERGVQAVTLGDVAVRAGMAKSNVLRYFETREEVYLQLTLEAYAEWNTVVAQQLAAGRLTPVDVADVLADTLAERPLVCDLFARVSSTLEHNVSPELGRDFKLRLLDHTQQLAAMILGALPDLREEQAFDMVAGGYALVAGLWPMCNPPAELAAALDGPALQHTRLAFHATLRRMLEALLVGVIHTRSTPP
jgi:AcrR family transcriptional regulator